MDGKANCGSVSVGKRSPYLLHDRDRIYGAEFQQRVDEMGILEVLTAPRSPWQNA